MAMPAMDVEELQEDSFSICVRKDSPNSGVELPGRSQG